MRPQLRLEEITLMPHPLDHWRLALDQLIAIAPGTPADVCLHLQDATRGQRSKPVISVHSSRALKQLLILAAAQLHGAAAPEPADHTASPSSAQPRPQTEPQASADPVAAQAESHSLSRQQLPGEAPIEQAHSPVPQASESGRS